MLDFLLIEAGISGLALAIATLALSDIGEENYVIWGIGWFIAAAGLLWSLWHIVTHNY